VNRAIHGLGAVFGVLTCLPSGFGDFAANLAARAFCLPVLGVFVLISGLRYASDYAHSRKPAPMLDSHRMKNPQRVRNMVSITRSDGRASVLASRLRAERMAMR
jgi:hypothetical protein